MTLYFKVLKTTQLGEKISAEMAKVDAVNKAVKAFAEKYGARLRDCVREGGGSIEGIFFAADKAPKGWFRYSARGYYRPRVKGPTADAAVEMRQLPRINRQELLNLLEYHPSMTAEGANLVMLNGYGVEEGADCWLLTIHQKSTFTVQEGMEEITGTTFTSLQITKGQK